MSTVFCNACHIRKKNNVRFKWLFYGAHTKYFLLLLSRIIENDIFYGVYYISGGKKQVTFESNPFEMFIYYNKFFVRKLFSL